MPTVEQTIDVLLHIALAAAHRRRVAEQQEQTRPWLQLAAGNRLQQAIEQLNGRGLIAVNRR